MISNKLAPVNHDNPCHYLHYYYFRNIVCFRKSNTRGRGVGETASRTHD